MCGANLWIFETHCWLGSSKSLGKSEWGMCLLEELLHGHEWIFFTDILACHSRKSKCVNNKIVGHLSGTEPFINLISNTCLLPTMKSQNMYYGKGPYSF